MIKKFPARLVGPIWHPKSIILKSQSSPKHSFKNQYLKAEQVGKKRFDEIFDPDNNTWESIKMKSVKSSAAEDIASRTGTKKWGTLIKKNLIREGIFKKTISTSKDKPSFIKKWQKSLDKADIGSEATRVRTSLLFTGRKGLDPLKHQTKDIKFITSKRFRKGKFYEPYPKHYSKLETAAHFEKKRMSKYFTKHKITKPTSKDWKGFWKTEKARKKEYKEKFYKPIK